MNLRLWIFLAAISAVFLPDPGQAQERRLALVVGNASYKSIDRLPTPAQDARLVTDALRRVGFTVTTASDLDEDALRRQYADFTRRIDEAGPDAIAIVYLAGYAMLADGTNFFLPVDIKPEQPEDIGQHGLSMDDVLNGLAGTAARVRMVVMDGARPVPGLDEEQYGAPGLGAVLLPEQAIAVLSAQPGAVVADSKERNSPFATAFSKYVVAPTLNVEEALRQTRCAVFEATKSTQLPWYTSTLTATFIAGDAKGRAPEDACEPLGERAESGERSGGSVQTYVPVPRPKPSGTRVTKERIRDLPPDDAYEAVIDDGSIDAYEDFTEIYPDDPRTYRFRERIDARHESDIWIQAIQQNTVEIYITYLQRYPHGSYRRQALARLERFGARAPDLPPLPDDWRERRRGPRAVVVGPGYFSPRPRRDYEPGIFRPDGPGRVIDIGRPGRDDRDREELELYRMERQREALEDQLRREQRQNERLRLERQRDELEKQLRAERRRDQERLERARAELEEQIRGEREASARERLQQRRKELEERLRERKEREGLIEARQKLEDELKDEKRQGERSRIEKQREDLERQLRAKREERVKEIEARTDDKSPADKSDDKKPSQAERDTPSTVVTPPGRATPPGEKPENAKRPDDSGKPDQAKRPGDDRPDADDKSKNNLLPRPGRRPGSDDDDKSDQATKPGEERPDADDKSKNDLLPRPGRRPGSDDENKPDQAKRPGDDRPDADDKSKNNLLPRPGRRPGSDGDDKPDQATKPGEERPDADDKAKNNLIPRPGRRPGSDDENKPDQAKRPGDDRPDADEKSKNNLIPRPGRRPGSDEDDKPDQTTKPAEERERPKRPVRGEDREEATRPPAEERERPKRPARDDDGEERTRRPDRENPAIRPPVEERSRRPDRDDDRNEAATRQRPAREDAGERRRPPAAEETAERPRRPDREQAGEERQRKPEASAEGSPGDERKKKKKQEEEEQ